MPLYGSITHISMARKRRFNYRFKPNACVEDYRTKGNNFMKQFIALSIMLLIGVSAYAGVRGFTTAGVNLGAFTDVKCGTALTCAKVSGQLKLSPASYGLAQNQVIGTGTVGTPTSATCGTTYVASAVWSINLPDATANAGCRYTFVNRGSSTFTINPADADQIKNLTNAAGDAIQSSNLSDVVTIESVGASTWVPIGTAYGTWSDVD